MTRHPGMRILQTASFTSSFDRVMIAPLLVMISEEFGLSLASVTIVATVHLLSYGAMQVLWALLSDRYGRVRTMRLALFAATLAAFASAAGDSLATLLVARAASGAAFAAVIPGALVYIGDTVAVRERQGPLTDLMRGTAVGAAVATVGSGLLADLTSWRVPFAVIGLAALLLTVFLPRLPEPTGLTPQSSRAALLTVVRSRWAMLVLALALGEGFVLLAVLTFVPAALQAGEGLSATSAGAVVAAYGAGALVTAPVVKRLSASAVPRDRLIAIGGLLAALSLFVFSAGQGVATMLTGCGMLGCGWAFVHSSLQTWATEVVPGARAAMVSLFATLLFLGNAAGAFAGGLVLGATDFPVLFLVFGVLGVPAMAAAWLGSRRYPG